MNQKGNKKNELKEMRTISDLQDNMKRSNIRIIGIPEEKDKKSQYIMNNTINEIRNTLEATNSRITKAEDRISDVEDRMVEINESEKKKEK